MKIQYLFLPAMTCCVVAQAPNLRALPDRGVLNTLEMGVVLGSDPETIALKEAGVQDGVSNVIVMPDTAGGGVRDYPAEYILEYLAYDGTLVFDALSTFNDLVPIYYDPAGPTPYFVIDQASGTDSWAILAMAVATQFNGVNASTIYGYYPENPGFPLQLRNAIYHEILPGEWTGLGGGDAGTEIVAMDIGLGLIHAGGGEHQPSLVSNTQSLFFSLTSASAALLWDAQINQELGTPIQRNPNSTSVFTGGTVFRVDYTSTGSIGGVSVHYEYRDLLLSETDELDALAVCVPTTAAPPDPSRGFVALEGTDFAIFSTTDPTRDLMVRGSLPCGTVDVAPLKTHDGNSPVPPSGSVSGVCAQDPDATINSKNQPLAFFTGAIDYLPLSAFATETVWPAGIPPVANTDSFDLHLSIAGWNGKTPGVRDMYLGLLVNGSPQMIALPRRMATDTNYQKKVAIAFQWLPPQTHIYEFGVLECLPGSMTPIDTTYAMRLVRSK